MIRAAFSIAATASVVAASHAGACSVISVHRIESRNYRAECRAVINDVDAYSANVRASDPFRWSTIEVAKALHDGSANCPQRPDVAFALVDGVIGSPVFTDPQSEFVLSFLQWKPAGFDQDRADEVAIGSWVTNRSWNNWSCSGNYLDMLPRGYSETQVTEWLVKPEYWAVAMEGFGHNPARDRIILRQLIDPQSVYFNLAEAARLTPYYFNRGEEIRPELIDIDVAEALTDPDLGEPDYETAAKLLAWYSPVSFRDMSEEARERARALWVRIAQSRLTSADPQLRSDAMLFFETGDPWAKAAIPLSNVLRANADIEVLDYWPDTLIPPLGLERVGRRFADHYPSRAIREWTEGRVELGLVFGPDGAFHSLHVSRGNSEVLENAAKRGIGRYFRPRIAEMKLEGFEGRYVYVPLPSFEYGLAYDANNVPSGYDAERNSFVIVAEPRRQY